MPVVSVSTSDISRPLSLADYKALFVATLSSALCVYDFIIFFTFFIVLYQLFLPPNMPSEVMLYPRFAMFFALVVAPPLGGLVMASFSDLLGRRQVFALSVVLMSGSTLVIALVPPYKEIGVIAPMVVFFARMLQGAAKGAQIPSAFVLVSERVPANKLGYACGILACGPALGVLAGMWVTQILSATSGYSGLKELWRIAFVSGSGIGLGLVFLCHWLPGNSASPESQRCDALPRPTLLKIVLRDHRAELRVCVKLAVLLATGFLLLYSILGTTLASRDHPMEVITRSRDFALIAFCVGSIAAGMLADRLGPGRVLAVGSLGLFMASWAFFGLSGNPYWVYPTYAILGLFLATFSLAPFIMVSSFAPAVRLVGTAFSYNIGASISVVLLSIPYIATASSDPLQMAGVVGILCGSGLFIGLMLRRRKV